MGIDLAPGKALRDGRYVLERRIGSGGMASVWLARDERLGRNVAVKVLAEALALESDYVKRFRREAKIAAQLFHPNLVRVFDFAVEEDRPFIVMEYVEGGDLNERLTANAEQIDPEALANDLLSAVERIHSVAIIHRDIKPSNVLIDDEGRARLSDFGIARPKDATRLTQTGQVLGTLRYVAPELLRGESPSYSSDLYSCGMVLGDCLPADATGRLADLADRLSAEDPAQRPGSAGEALATMERGREGRTPPTLPLQTESVHKRRELHLRLDGRVALVALLVALAIAGLIALSRDDGGGSTPAVSLKPVPSHASLRSQLDVLERDVMSASGR